MFPTEPESHCTRPLVSCYQAPTIQFNYDFHHCLIFTIAHARHPDTIQLWFSSVIDFHNFIIHIGESSWLNIESIARHLQHNSTLILISAWFSQFSHSQLKTYCLCKERSPQPVKLKETVLPCPTLMWQNVILYKDNSFQAILKIPSGHRSSACSWEMSVWSVFSSVSSCKNVWWAD